MNESDPKANPNPTVWWKHRRRMAYISLAFTIVQTVLWGFLGVIDPTAIASLGAVIGWAYSVPTACLLSYFGSAAVDDFANKKLMR